MTEGTVMVVHAMHTMQKLHGAQSCLLMYVEQQLLVPSS